MNASFYRVLLAVYAVFFLLLLLIKPVQLGFMSAHRVTIADSDKQAFIQDDIDPSESSGAAVLRVDYAKLDINYLISVGIAQRFANVSFWNLITLSVGLFMLVKSFELVSRLLTPPNSDPETYLDSILQWNEKDWLLYILITGFALFVYLMQVSHDNELRVAGTFYCNTKMVEIKHLQVIEGLIFVTVIVTGFLIPFAANKLTCALFKEFQTQEGRTQYWQVVSRIANIGITPVLWCICFWLFASLGLSRLKVGTYSPVPPPNVMALVSTLLWYLPFVWVPYTTVKYFINSARSEMKIDVKSFTAFVQFERHPNAQVEGD